MNSSHDLGWRILTHRILIGLPGVIRIYLFCQKVWLGSYLSSSHLSIRFSWQSERDSIWAEVGKIPGALAALTSKGPFTYSSQFKRKRRQDTCLHLISLKIMHKRVPKSFIMNFDCLQMMTQQNISSFHSPQCNLPTRTLFTPLMGI